MNSLKTDSFLLKDATYDPLSGEQVSRPEFSLDAAKLPGPTDLAFTAESFTINLLRKDLAETQITIDVVIHPDCKTLCSAPTIDPVFTLELG